MNGRPLTLPTWDRLATGLVGVPIVQIAFFPIYLGCAAVSGNGGWQEGAVAAAWKQVKQLHETAMTSKPTISKQTSGA